MHITIGTVKTLTVANWNIVPDDRQEKMETIGGVVVQDFGHVQEGDVITCKVTILAGNDVNTLWDYWHNRTFVDVVDAAGATYNNRRIIVKKYKYLDGFTKYYEVELEIWGI